MNTDTVVNSVKDLVEIGRSMGEIMSLPGGEPFVLAPNGFRVESLSALVPPTRIKQQVTLIESGSFIEYVNRFKSDSTLIFVDVTDSGAKFIAILDYHSQAPECAPAYGSHTARFECVPTHEWKTWMSRNATRMDQVQFATFLEEAVDLIVSPPGAELLEIVQNLYGHSDARFNSALRMQSGAAKFTFDEDVVLRGTQTTKSGDVDLPLSIVAGISPFEGTDPYEVKCRLKYRIENRKLSLWYETINPHKIVRDSVLTTTSLIAKKTGIIPLVGRP